MLCWKSILYINAGLNHRVSVCHDHRNRIWGLDWFLEKFGAGCSPTRRPQTHTRPRGQEFEEDEEFEEFEEFTYTGRMEEEKPNSLSSVELYGQDNEGYVHTEVPSSVPPPYLSPELLSQLRYEENEEHRRSRAHPSGYHHERTDSGHHGGARSFFFFFFSPFLLCFVAKSF